MMGKLEEKRDLIQKYGTINYIPQTQNQLITPSQAFSYRYFRDLFEKLKILFENYKYLKKEN